MSVNYKNLGLNDSEREWILKVRSIITPPPIKNEEEPIILPPDDEIWYTSSDGNIVRPASRIDTDVETGDSILIYDGPYNDIFGADIISNTYENGKGIIKFDGNVTKLEPSEEFIGNFSMFNEGDGGSNSRLTSITIPNSITSIGGAAFYDCTGLTSITIPNSVTIIGDSAFANCFNLSSITVNNNNTVYDSRGNCNAIIETATNTLILGCKNTIIPNSVTIIEDYAFYNCSELTTLNIPNSVTRIGCLALYNCYGLTSITIPNSVTIIEDEVFAGCYGLTSITILNTTPPTLTLGGMVFDNMSDCPIYVPSESVNTYKSSWSDYANRIQAIQ